MAVWNVMDVLPKLLSEATGAEITGARLFTTLLYVYPVTIVQRFLLHDANANLHHIYNTLTAAVLMYFNFGNDSAYFILNVLAAYVIMVTLKSSQNAVIASLILNMAVLLYAYIHTYLYTQIDERYVTCWSTPHCVLTLKLIGVQWDVYDGAQKDLKGKEQTAIASAPTLLELLGFCYYPAAMMTGPQISFKKYVQFTEGKFNEGIESSWNYGLQRLALGIILILSYPILSPYLSTSYFFTEQYKNSWMITKAVAMGLWGQIVLNRYLGVWLVAEGSCIFSGIAYNGKDDKGNVIWNGCANIKVERYFTATQTQHFIEGFNINTNKWVLTYVYKRLRFLNNRLISQGVSLAFLALWHGFATGYFMCFFLEFIMVNGEKQMVELCNKKAPLKSLVAHPLLSPLITLMSKVIATFSLSYGLISFEQFYYSSYMEIYANTSYILHIVYILCPVVYVLLSLVLPDAESEKKKN